MISVKCLHCNTLETSPISLPEPNKRRTGLDDGDRDTCMEYYPKVAYGSLTNHQAYAKLTLEELIPTH